MLTAETFLASIFEGAKGIVVTANAEEGFKRRRLKPGRKLDGKIYYCISTVRDVPRDDVLPARTKDLVATHAIVLDDVGAKVDPRLIKLQPTYKLRTSMPNGVSNEQWGYVLEIGVEPARAAALIEALAKAGLTDAGAKRADRIMRLPGSINDKYGEPFAAELLEFHEDRLFAYSEVCVGLDVTPTDTPAHPSGPPDLPDGMVDPAVPVMYRLGMVLGDPNPRGWLPIRCPKEHEHTGDVDHGCDYKPGMPGIFKCMHSHGDKLTTRWFRDWLKEQAPDADLSIVPRELCAQLGTKLARALGIEINVEVAEAKGIPREEWAPMLSQAAFTILQEQGAASPLFRPNVQDTFLADLTYVASEKQYWSIKYKTLTNREGVDDLWSAHLHADRALMTTDAGGRPKPIAPSKWLRENVNVRRVSGLTHRLGEPLIVRDREGNDYLNIAPKWPEPAEGEGEPTPWLEAVSYACNGDSDIIEWYLDWLAMVVGTPHEKTGFHIILRGPQGTCKNLSVLPLVKYLQPDHQQDVTTGSIGSDFNGFLEKRLVSFNEASKTTRGVATGHDVYNNLKAWTARSADLVPINQKNRKIYMAADRSCWVITSNKGVPLPIDDDDRRFMVIETPRKKFPPERGIKIAKWILEGGYETAVAWLQRRWNAMTEGERDDLRGEAPMTAAKQTLIINSAEGIRGAIRSAIVGSHGVTWPDLMRSEDIYIQMTGLAFVLLPAKLHREVTLQRITKSLEELGAVRLKQAKDTNRKNWRIWCLRPDNVARYELLGTGSALVEEYLRQQKSIGPGGS
jgi:hypothetical protein